MTTTTMTTDDWCCVPSKWNRERQTRGEEKVDEALLVPRDVCNLPRDERDTVKLRHEQCPWWPAGREKERKRKTNEKDCSVSEQWIQDDKEEVKLFSLLSSSHFFHLLLGGHVSPSKWCHSYVCTGNVCHLTFSSSLKRISLASLSEKLFSFAGLFFLPSHLKYKFKWIQVALYHKETFFRSFFFLLHPSSVHSHCE